jgi:hypothetical protein
MSYEKMKGYFSVSQCKEESKPNSKLRFLNLYFEQFLVN